MWIQCLAETSYLHWTPWIPVTTKIYVYCWKLYYITLSLSTRAAWEENTHPVQMAVSAEKTGIVKATHCSRRHSVLLAVHHHFEYISFQDTLLSIRAVFLNDIFFICSSLFIRNFSVWCVPNVYYIVYHMWSMKLGSIWTQ